jgi:zinc protease
MLAEITRLPTAEVTQAELAARKTMQIGSFGRSIETADGLGNLITNMAVYDVPLSGLASYARDIEAVTPAQVQAAAAEHLSPAGVSLVIVGDSSIFIDDLRARYPGVEVVPLTALNLDSASLR